MIDFKALRGDPSDNIKGVAGIGEKTAGQLIQDFGSIEGLYKAIKSGKTEGNIKPRILQLLTDGEKDAEFSYQLSKIVCNVPLDIDIPGYEFKMKHLNPTIKLFQELEFKSLVDKLPKNYVGQTNVVPTEEGLGETKLIESGVAQDIGKQDYQLVDTNEKLDKLVVKMAKLKEFVIDTEMPITLASIGLS